MKLVIQGLLHGQCETSPLGLLGATDHLLVGLWWCPCTFWWDWRVASQASWFVIGSRWQCSGVLAWCPSHFIPGSPTEPTCRTCSCSMHEPESRIWSHDLWGETEVQGTVGLEKGQLWGTDSLFSNIQKNIWRPPLQWTLWSKCPAGTKEVSFSSCCTAGVYR